jgi:hypothetical protein
VATGLFAPLTGWHIRKIGPDFRNISATHRPIVKRMAPLDLMHQTCPLTSLDRVPIIVGCLSLLQSKRRDIGPDFRNIAASHRAIAKWMAPLDSAGQICPSTSFEGILPVGGAFAAGNCKSSEIGADFHDISTTRSATAMQMEALDLAHQICPWTLPDDVLVVVWGPCGGAIKKREN